MLLRKFPAPLFLLLFVPLVASAATDTWHRPQDVTHLLKSYNRSKRTSLDVIGRTADGNPLSLLTVHPVNKNDQPAILVIGNPDGTTPLGTEAALALIENLLATRESGSREARWYILPQANPDGTAGFFAHPRRPGGLNSSPVDEDRDGDFGEDPGDDLNGDGLITTMLVPDEAGRWIINPEQPLLTTKADPAAGQRGIYRRCLEGRDDDQDGLFNEDGPGGVNPGRNFPHRFVPWTNQGGRWAADQPESRAILEFAFAHPDIAMILVLGRVNNLRAFPQPPADPGTGKLAVPERWAAAWGVQPGQSFSMAQLKELVGEFTGQTEVTERQVRGYLEQDAATTVDPEDFAWWGAVGREYALFLKASGLDGARLPSATSLRGSVEQWGYFQFGVPTFAIDFWSLPSPAPVDSTAEAVPFTDQQRALLKFTAGTRADPRLADYQGLRPWEKTTLPDGRAVLVGGRAPFACTTPPSALVDSLLHAPAGYLARLPHWLPRLEFGGITLTPKGAQVYELEVWLKNEGPLPYPTGQGLRTQRVPPVVVTVKGATLLEGRPRATVEQLPAYGSRKVRWLLRLPPDKKITITASAPSLGTITTSRGGLK